MKKFLISCLILAILLPQTVFAAEIETYVNFDTRDVTISGSVEQAAFNRMVSVIVSDGKKQYYVDTVGTDSDGSYNLTFRMPEDAGTGSYKISVDALGLSDVIEYEFYFAKGQDITNTLTSINNTANAGAMRNVVDDNTAVLNIPEEWYSSLGSAGKTAIAEALYKSKPYKTISDATDVAYKELAVQAFRYAGNADSIEKALGKFNDVYNINEDTAVCYELYTNSGFGKEAREIMVSYDSKNVDEVVTAYNESVLLAAINNSKDPLSIQQLISDYRVVIPFSLDTYNKADSEKMAAYLYKNTHYKSMSALETAIADAYKQQSSSGSTGGSGGGSSSGGGGGSSSGGKSGGSSGVINSPPTSGGYNAVQMADNTDTAIFSDLIDAQWAREAIEYLAERNIVSGIGNNKFEPGSYVTREQFVLMIINAFNMQKAGASSDFDDIPKNHWAYDAVSSACESGIVFGLSDSEFGTGQRITRQDMAVIAYRAAKLAGYEFDGTGEITFADKAEISDYALESVSGMSANGIINGYPDGRFGPSDTANRAQAAQIIYSIIK